MYLGNKFDPLLFGPMDKKQRSHFPMSSDFLFGPLSTDAGRLQRTRTERLGFLHDLTLQPIAPQPHDPITLLVTVGADIAVDTVDLFYTVEGDAAEWACLDINYLQNCLQVKMQRSVQWDTLAWCELERWSATLTSMAEGAYVQYLFRGKTWTGETIYCPTFYPSPLRQDSLFHELEQDQLAKRVNLDLAYLQRLCRSDSPQIYSFVVEEKTSVEWFEKAIIYQIFIDRFAPEPGESFDAALTTEDFHHGTLKGITHRLDYLSDLGITCLWLTPIFPSPTYHGYDATGYGQIELRLGTTEDFSQLLAAAAERNIRVVLDYIANHCSQQHPAFISATQSQSSDTYPRFRFTFEIIDFEIVLAKIK